MEIETIQLLESFDSNIQELYLSNKNIKGLLDLGRFTRLKKLKCTENEITEIINFPETLKELNCEQNKIKFFDNLPPNLIFLCCRSNDLTLLDNLPTTLRLLDCSYNIKIESLDYLPANLYRLECAYCKIKDLKLLPKNIKQMDCQGNHNLVLEGLPQTLESLLCSKIPIDAPIDCNISLEWWPNNPINIEELKAKYNNLTVNYINLD